MNAKSLIKLARTVSFGKRSAGSSPSRGKSTADEDHVCSSSTSDLPSKGHLFVYTFDRMRFMIPLEYLNTNIFRELLQISEEDFGFTSDGPITMPCDVPCMEYIISLIHSKVSGDIETALLTSIANNRCCVDRFASKQRQPIVYGF